MFMKSCETSIWRDIKYTDYTNQSVKLSTQFPVKNIFKFEHRYNVVYFSYCPNVICSETYLGETDRQINERMIDHNKWDKNSHLAHSRMSKNLYMDRRF